MKILFIDTETLGLSGPARLFQWGLLDGENPDSFRVKMARHSPFSLDVGWGRPEFCLEDLRADLQQADLIVGYNLAFDLPRLFEVFGTFHPFTRYIDLQLRAQTDSILAPFAAIKKGERAAVKISRIPFDAVAAVVAAVEERITPHLPETIKLKHSVHQVKGRPDLSTVSFYVDGRIGLKNLVQAYGIAETASIDETGWPLPKDEDTAYLGYQACHREIEEAALDCLQNNKKFLQYAENDVLFTRAVWEKLGKPTKPNDNDYCAAAVATARHIGVRIDHPMLTFKIHALRKHVKAIKKALQFDPASPKQRLEFLRMEFPGLKSTGKKVLSPLRSASTVADNLCRFGEYVQRLNQMARLHRQPKGTPGFRVIGTATNRMAGDSGLNWQGFSSEKHGIREAIKFVAVGDFDTLEVIIAATVYQDPILLADIQAGLDLHLHLATIYHPALAGTDYRSNVVLKNQGDAKVTKARKEMKAVVFGSLYGAQAPKIAETAGMDIDTAQTLLDGFWDRYRKAKKFKDKLEARFVTGDTEHWSEDSVAKMDDSITDILGFTRRFEFEKLFADELWRMSKEPIPGLPEGVITRREARGPQPYQRAVMSALLGAALTIQKTVARQVCNSVIQSVGAGVTKALMALLHRHGAVMIQVHDELCLIKYPEGGKEMLDSLTESFLEEYRKKIPNLNIEFKETERWSEK